MKDWLVDFIKSGVFVQGTLALVTVGAVVYLAVAQLSVPPELAGIAGSAVGFYFGQKVLNK